MNIITAYGYARISSTEQKNGFSIANQITSIERYCDYKNYKLKKVYEDLAFTGTNINRPGLQELLSTLKKGDIMIVNDLTRLSRNTIDTLTLIQDLVKKGIIYVCLNPEIVVDNINPHGQMFLTILSSVGQFETDNLKFRIKTTMQNMSKNSLLRQRAPFGYYYKSHNEDMQPDDQQQTTLEKIKNLHSTGYSNKQISDVLNKDGDNKFLANNKKNKDRLYFFHPETIRRILIDYGIVDVQSKRHPIDLRIKSGEKRKLEKNIH